MGDYFATVARGLENLAAEELQELGAQRVVPGFCGVAFGGDRALLYRVNLWARLPFRILQTVTQFPCGDADDLYRGIQSVDWRQFLGADQTLAVTATGKTQHLNHSHFTALQVKNAVVDQQRQQGGKRSSVDVETPDVRINVHLAKNQATVSLDSSGHSLHRRGYRVAMGTAPLKESLAAAMIRLSGWQPTQALVDPLCGSGTLPLEASLVALNRAPGLYCDRMGFETWPDFDRPLWERLKAEAAQGQKAQLLAPIYGCDRDDQVIRQARSNAKRCGVGQQVQFQQRDLATVEAPADSGILLCNPPYGERLGRGSDLTPFYKLLGDVLKQRFQGWTAFVLSGNKQLAQAIGLKSSQRWALNNGNLPCQLLRYELY
ncbi:MAG: THUMP domain-containing protein [Cyanobacteria bacterium]|nr:THUMP domain-containing protein [Cyanobacteriota bacterium]MEB3267672.1 THUMP domain-containing protein [Leptolyngbya sp.]